MIFYILIGLGIISYIGMLVCFAILVYKSDLRMREYENAIKEYLKITTKL